MAGHTDQLHLAILDKSVMPNQFIDVIIDVEIDPKLFFFQKSGALRRDAPKVRCSLFFFFFFAFACFVTAVTITTHLLPPVLYIRIGLCTFQTYNH